MRYKRGLIEISEYLSVKEMVSMMLVCREWWKCVDVEEVWQGRLSRLELFREVRLGSAKSGVRLIGMKGKWRWNEAVRAFVTYDLQSRKMIEHTSLFSLPACHCVLPNGNLFLNTLLPFLLDLYTGCHRVLPSSKSSGYPSLGWSHCIYVFGMTVLQFDTRKWEWTEFLPVQFSGIIDLFRKENEAFLLLRKKIVRVNLDTREINEHVSETWAFNQLKGLFPVRKKVAVLSEVSVLLVDLEKHTEEWVRHHQVSLPESLQYLSDDSDYVYLRHHTKVYQYNKSTFSFSVRDCSPDSSFRFPLRVSQEVQELLLKESKP